MTSKSEEQLSWNPESVWTAPPKPLPGPDDHPFFKARPKFPGPDADEDSSRPGSSSTYQPLYPPVLPFIPKPTISRESSTTEKRGHDDVSHPERATPQNPKEKSSSTRSSLSTNSTASVAQTDSTSNSPSSTRIKPEDQDRDQDTDQDADCKWTYTCTTNAHDTNRRHVLHGQIWRGGEEEGQSWQRNQWVTDG